MAGTKVPEVKIRDLDGLSQGWGGSGLHVDGNTTFKQSVEVQGDAELAGATELSGATTITAAGDAAAVTASTGTPNTFAVRKATEAAGYHVYQEEVTLIGASTATDHGMICYLSKTLPANAKIVSAAMTVTELASAGTFLCELNLSSTTSTARGVAATSPTELIGASAGSGALTASSGGALGDTEVSAAAAGVDVGAKTSVLVCNDSTGNGTSAITAGAVLVTIEYYGSAAPA